MSDPLLAADSPYPKPRLKGWIYGIALLMAIGGVVARLAVNKHPPGPAAPPYARGMDAVARGDLSAAEREFGNAIHAAPTFVDAYEYLAEVEIASGRPGTALQVVQELGRRRPDAPHLAALFAESYALGDNVQLMRWARTAVMDEPRSPRAHVLMALALVRSGDKQDALARLVVANYLEPSSRLQDVIHAKAPENGKRLDLALLIAPLIPQASL